MTSLMEEIEPVGRDALVPVAVVRVVAGLVAGEGRDVEEDKLGRARGAFFTPSDTEARGRDAADALVSVADARAAAAAVGLAPADEAREAREAGAFVADEGATDVRLVAVVLAVRVGLVELELGAAAGFVGAAVADEVVDFRSVEVAGGLLAPEEVGAGLVAPPGFADPAPNVPELKI